MLRKVSYITKYIIGTSSLKSNRISSRNIYLFCSNHEPPKGFEKFKRSPKSTKQLKEEEDNRNTSQDLEGKQEIKKDRKQKDPDQSKNDDESKSKSGANSSQNKDDPEEKYDKDENLQQQSRKHKQSEERLTPDPRSRRNAILLALAGLGVLVVYSNDWSTNISYTEFVRDYLEKDAVSHIIIQREASTQKIIATIYTSSYESVKMTIGNVDHFLEELEKAQQVRGKGPDSFIPIEFKTTEPNNTVDRSINLVYLAITLAIAYTLYKSIKSTMGQISKGGGDMFGMGKSNVKQFDFEQQIKVKFKDVAGLDEAKYEIKEFVDFLKKPKKYKDIGAKIPRGALLSGPPGTGKTMLAKACAGEAGVPFFYVSGSDFVEMFVGVGASRVRDLFKQAKSKSPSIVFIDEIDAVGRKRESRAGGNDERDNTLNQLLVEMDGFGTDHNVVVLAATNRKELLDPALTRPGRFDRTVDITLPDIEGRMQIFLVHLQPLKLDLSKDIQEYAKRLATLTPGFSGAEISNLCNEAAILAARKNKTTVGSDDFEMAAERVMAGLEKKQIISPEERKVVAYHESGHAVVSWFLEGGNPLLKLTIIPRSKGSLGYAQYLPSESSLETREELIDRICCILGGRCSEQHFFGKVTTGASNDLQKAYQTAHSIVTKFGMSDLIGYVGYQETEYNKPYSDSTNKKIDQEIKKIVDECTVKVMQLLVDHHQDVENLSQALLEKETLDLYKIVDILGERPFPPKSNYKMYLELKKIEKKEREQEKEEKDAIADAQSDKEKNVKQEEMTAH